MELGSGWSPEQVSQQFANDGNQKIRLDQPIPVHVTYFTVGVSDDGSLTYFERTSVLSSRACSPT
jgi:murein L,D-transpeptidase YcbB/YkuD